MRLMYDSWRVILIVYMDDIIIIGDDSTRIEEFKTFLHTRFHTKGLEKLRYFLGIEIGQSTEGISLTQWKFVLDILDETS